MGGTSRPGVIRQPSNRPAMETARAPSRNRFEVAVVSVSTVRASVVEYVPQAAQVMSFKVFMALERSTISTTVPVGRVEVHARFETPWTEAPVRGAGVPGNCPVAARPSRGGEMRAGTSQPPRRTAPRTKAQQAPLPP